MPTARARFARFTLETSKPEGLIAVAADAVPIVFYLPIYAPLGLRLAIPRNPLILRMSLVDVSPLIVRGPPDPQRRLNAIQIRGANHSREIVELPWNQRALNYYS